MTAMQLVVDSRDSEEIWLARAAPRRWYAEGFGVRNGPTRYGNVTYALDAMADSKIRLSLSADFTQLPHVHAPQPTLHARVRWPGAGDASPAKQIAAATVADVSPASAAAYPLHRQRLISLTRVRRGPTASWSTRTRRRSWLTFAPSPRRSRPLQTARSP